MAFCGSYICGYKKEFLLNQVETGYREWRENLCGSDNANLYAMYGVVSLANTPWLKFRHDLPNIGRQWLLTGS